MGLFQVASALGDLMAHLGEKEQARKLLTLAVSVGRQSDFPGLDELESLLNKLNGSE